MFDTHVARAEAEQITAGLGLRIRRRISAVGNLYHLSTDDAPSYDVLVTVNPLAERDDVDFAEPNLLTTAEEDAITPTDFLFPEQWDHQIINTPDAWQFLRNIDVSRTFRPVRWRAAACGPGVPLGHPEVLEYQWQAVGRTPSAGAGIARRRSFSRRSLPLSGSAADGSTDGGMAPRPVRCSASWAHSSSCMAAGAVRMGGGRSESSSLPAGTRSSRPA